MHSALVNSSSRCISPVFKSPLRRSSPGIPLAILFRIVVLYTSCFFFFFQAEDGIRDKLVTGVQTCALPISLYSEVRRSEVRRRPPDFRPSYLAIEGNGWNEDEHHIENRIEHSETGWHRILLSPLVPHAHDDWNHQHLHEPIASVDRGHLPRDVVP